jgi:hypothetical protein
LLNISNSKGHEHREELTRKLWLAIGNPRMIRTLTPYQGLPLVRVRDRSRIGISRVSGEASGIWEKFGTFLLISFLAEASKFLLCNYSRTSL